MQITCPIHPTPSSPPVSPSAFPMPSSSPETAPLTPPCIPTSVPSRLSWHGPNLFLSLPHVKFYVSFYFSLHQRPHLLCTNVPTYFAPIPPPIFWHGFLKVLVCLSAEQMT